jgi:hypothetical protein
MATILATAKSVYFTMYWVHPRRKARPQTISLGDLRRWNRSSKNSWESNRLAECVRNGLVIKVIKPQAPKSLISETLNHRFAK